METDSRLPTGEWNGFYLEHGKRGWMHLYLAFENEKIKGEGTDYVGPWVASGSYDLGSGKCFWTKQYLGQHQVVYQGHLGQSGIAGSWTIGQYLTDTFHIWPKGMNHLNEMYLKQDLSEPAPVPFQIENVPFEQVDNIV